MPDDLEPPMIPQGNGGDTSPKKQTSRKSSKRQNKDVGVASRKRRENAKSAAVATLIFAASVCLSEVFWQLCDGLTGWWLVVVHWLSICLGVAGFFGAWHSIIKGKGKKEKRKKLWTWFAVSCVAVALISVTVWKPGPEPPKPHFKFVLNTSDSPNADLELPSRVVDTVKVQEIKRGLFIPVQTGTSEVSLRLLAINDSPNVADDAEVAVAFVSELKCSFAAGWKRAIYPKTWWGKDRTGKAPHELQYWFFPFSGMLPSNGIYLPEIIIDTPPYHSAGSPDSVFWVLGRARDWPSTESLFDMIFVQATERHRLLNPVVLSAKTNVDGISFHIPDEYFTTNK